MSAFEYLSVFLSVIMGLGVTHVLAGLSKIIHSRSTVKPFWVHTLWAFNILIYIIAIWWGMFWWSTQTDWSFFQFLLLLSYSIVLFIAASLLFPWDVPQTFDFESHFFETRAWFFAALFVAWCIDVPETVMKANEGARDLPYVYAAFVSGQLLIAAIAVFWSSARFHMFYAVFWPIYTIGYLTVTTLAKIAS